MTAETSPDALHGGPPGSHYVAELAELEPNRIHRLQIDGRTIGVVRTHAGVFAIGNRCPHQGGPMCSGKVAGTMLAAGPDQYVYGEDGLVVKCPWHAYEFHLATGRSIGGVVRGRLPVFEVTVRDGAVYVALSPTRKVHPVR